MLWVPWPYPTRKPPPGMPVKVDRGSPLARGLVGCWLVNEGAGEKMVSLVNRADVLSFIGTTTPKWSPHVGGLGLNCNQGTDQGAGTRYSPVPDRFKLQNLTLFWLGALLGDGDLSPSNPRIAGVDFDNANGSPFVSYVFYRASATAVAFGWNNGSFQSVTPANSLTTGELLSLALTHTSGAVRGYKNALQIASSVTAGTISYSATSTLNAPGINSNNADPGVHMRALYIFDGVKSQDEIQRLHAEPYAFLLVPEVLTGLWPVGITLGGAGKFLPERHGLHPLTDLVGVGD